MTGGSAAAADAREDHLLGGQGQLLGRWRGHGAGGFRRDVIEDWRLDFRRLLFLRALRAFHALGWRWQAV